MRALQDSRPLPLFEGIVIMLAGVVLLVLPEAGKWLLRKLGWFDELVARPRQANPVA